MLIRWVSSGCAIRHRQAGEHPDRRGRGADRQLYRGRARRIAAFTSPASRLRAGGAGARGGGPARSLALVDIRLTGPLDGIELACLLRERLAHAGNLPVRACGRRDHAGAPKRRSRSAFLPKPFLPSQVFKAIERALAGAKPARNTSHNSLRRNATETRRRVRRRRFRLDPARLSHDLLRTNPVRIDLGLAHDCNRSTRLTEPGPRDDHPQQTRRLRRHRRYASRRASRSGRRMPRRSQPPRGCRRRPSPSC